MKAEVTSGIDLHAAYSFGPVTCINYSNVICRDEKGNLPFDSTSEEVSASADEL